MLSLFFKSLSNKEVLSTLLKPFFISLAFSLILGLILFAPFYPLIDYLLSIQFVKNIAGDVSTIDVMFYLYYQLVIVVTSLVNAFFVEKITLVVNRNYYNLPTRKTSILQAIFETLKGLGLFLLVFPFTFFLLFIPFVNIFYQLFLWTILNRNSLIYDSSSLFCNVQEIKQKLYKKITFIVFVTSAIYFIPFVNIFGYTLQLILLTHFILNFCKGQR